jgi:hypothetical protein
MSSEVKCDVCNTPADFSIINASAKDQLVCKEHLPWIYKDRPLPENVSSIDVTTVKKDESKNASGKNSDKASTSSAKQGDLAEGPIPTGDTSGN